MKQRFWSQAWLNVKPYQFNFIILGKEFAHNTGEKRHTQQSTEAHIYDSPNGAYHSTGLWRVWEIVVGRSRGGGGGRKKVGGGVRKK